MRAYRIEISTAARDELDRLDAATQRRVLGELGRLAVARSRFTATPAWDGDRLDALELDLEESAYRATVLVDSKNAVLYVEALARADAEKRA